MFTQSRKQGTKRARGSILVLASVGVAVAAIALLVAYSFCGLFFVQNRLQTSADEIALAGAKVLNERDRLGQMNNMIMRCRQLVFSSRADLEKTRLEFPDYVGFADPLLQEAKDSASKLELERQLIATRAQSEAASVMQRRFDEIKPTYAMHLPWMTVQVPNMEIREFGKVDGVESNVAELNQLEPLAREDRSRGLVVSFPRMNIYKAEEDLQFPKDDRDVHFNLSSLPAPVEGAVAPPRNFLSRSYKKAANGYAPSAAQIELKLKVETGLGFYTSSLMQSRGTASTNGASRQM